MRKTSVPLSVRHEPFNTFFSCIRAPPSIQALAGLGNDCGGCCLLRSTTCWLWLSPGETARHWATAPHYIRPRQNLLHQLFGPLSSGVLHLLSSQSQQTSSQLVSAATRHLQPCSCQQTALLCRGTAYRLQHLASHSTRTWNIKAGLWDQHRAQKQPVRAQVCRMQALVWHQSSTCSQQLQRKLSISTTRYTCRFSAAQQQDTMASPLLTLCRKACNGQKCVLCMIHFPPPQCMRQDEACLQIMLIYLGFGVYRGLLCCKS